MKQIYLECNMGAAGDMLMAALLELYPDKEGFLHQMNSLGFPGINVSCIPTEKCGINGSHISVTVNGAEEISEDVLPDEHDHQHGQDQDHDHCHEHGGHHDHCNDHSHHHFGMNDILTIINQAKIPSKVKKDAIAVYRLIGEAESNVHNVPVEQIHFHEIGSLDAAIDVIGCCLLFYLLKIDKIVASPIHVGSGFVRCAHGVLPVPAPATAYILRGIPIYSGNIRSELCTPTGAAILKHFVQSFSAMPIMSVDAIGYGFGTKDFENANCLRAFLSETENMDDEISELCCNLDDMTPEAIGYAMDVLMGAGALDVYSTPIQMKKNRPSVLFTCLCRIQDSEKMAVLMLQHTTTIGVRKNICPRCVLVSSFTSVQTKYGEIMIKISNGHGIKKCKPEYSDVAAIAKELKLDFNSVYTEALLAAEKLI